MQFNFKKIITISVLITGSVLTYKTALADKLIFATEITRHGQRTPSIDLPNFPSTDPSELGQLTLNGIDQQIRLGEARKEDYIKKYHLLNSSYQTNQVYARSTDLDRTLMSANAFLIGMFTHENRPQPFAIHTLPIQDDELLLGYLKYYDFVATQKLSNPKIAELSISLEPQFVRLSSLLDMSINDLDDFTSAVDTLYIRKQLNQPIPAELTVEEVNDLYLIARKAIALTWQKREVGALTTYKLINEIKNNISKIIKNNKDIKFSLYSAHDVTLLGLLSAIGIPAEYNPEPSSSISILLFADEQTNNQYYVKLFLNNEELRIPDCDNKTACTLSEFENLTDKIRIIATSTPTDQ